MKVFCSNCKHYKYCGNPISVPFHTQPTLHSCRSNPKPNYSYTSTPICETEWVDEGLANCEVKNEKNDCKEFKKKWSL